MTNHGATLRIALIGSRVLEQDRSFAADAALYGKVCYRLAQLGVSMTSGLCYAGADAIAQRAYAQAIKQGMASVDQLEVYVINQKAIDQSRLPHKEVSIIAPSEYEKERVARIRTVMNDDHWQRCSDRARLLHGRNVHQIFGYDLKNKVDAAIVWCQMDNNQRPKGGTATAYKLCLNHGIPVFNLWYANKTDVLEQISLFLKHKGLV